MTVPAKPAPDGHQTAPGPGLIVFGDSLQLRFANQRARDLLGAADRLVGDKTSGDQLTLEILQMSESVLKRLHESLAGQDWSYADLHKQIRLQDSMLDVRAFGFAGLTHRDDVHIVMLLNTVAPGGSFSTAESQDRHPWSMPAEH